MFCLWTVPSAVSLWCLLEKEEGLKWHRLYIQHHTFHAEGFTVILQFHRSQSTLGGCRNSGSGGRQSKSLINIERIPNYLLWWCFRAACCMFVGIRCDTKYWTFQEDAKIKAIQGSKFVWVSIFKPSCNKQNALIYAIWDYSLDILLEYEVVPYCSKGFFLKGRQPVLKRWRHWVVFIWIKKGYFGPAELQNKLQNSQTKQFSFW